MADLQELLEAYDEAISQRPATEVWTVKRYPDAFVVCRLDDSSRIELKHQRDEGSDSIQLVCEAEEGDPRELLEATRLIGPIRVAIDGSGRLCLRSNYRSEWGALGDLAYAAGVLDASVRLLGKVRFRSVTSADRPLQVRMATSLEGAAPALNVAPGPPEVEIWLNELKLRFLQARPTEWQLQTFGASGVGYTSRLNLVGASLVVLSYGSPNDGLVIDADFVRKMLRYNDRSGIGKLTLVTYDGTGRTAPTVTIEWPAMAVNSAENLGHLVASMTDHLEQMWGEMRTFFVPE